MPTHDGDEHMNEHVNDHAQDGAAANDAGTDTVDASQSPVAQSQAVDAADADETEAADETDKPVWYRRIRWWGWILIAIAAVIVVFFGAVGTQALLVKHHEEAAITVVKNAVKQNRLNDLDGVIADVQKETRAAKDITNGGLWSFTEKIPGIKGSMRVVRMMTDVVDDMAQETAPKYADAIKQIDVKSMYKNGHINVEPILKALPELETAARSLQRNTEAFDKIPVPRIGIVADTLIDSRTQLDAINKYVQDGTFEYAPKLPEWLGYEGKQTYAVLAVTPAEMRAGGGLIGAVGTVTITDGAVEIGDFVSNLDFAGGDITATNVTTDESLLYQQKGPLHLSYDVRDIANSPDNARAADMFRNIWERTETGKDTELNGVVFADPLVVQALVRVLGDVTLPDGTVLNGSNTADFLINTAYREYDYRETDAIFGTVAEACVKRLMGDLQKGKIVSLASQMIELGKNRHLSVYSFDPTLEKLFSDMELTSTLPLDETEPEVGIYFTENNPSKMGWYLKRSTTITQLDCGEQGPAKYHVTYTIKNTMTKEESMTLPEYITGMPYAQSKGAGMERIVFMPPAGGAISNFEVTGNSGTPVADSLNYRLIYTTLTQVQPESEVTYSFDVTVSPYAMQKLGIDETPTTSEKPSVTYTKLCRVE